MYVSSRKVEAFPRLPMLWRCWMLIVTLIVLGGLGLLGSLVLLVVCSGINDRIGAPAQPWASTSIRDDMPRAAAY
jgi:hypothetical protein